MSSRTVLVPPTRVERWLENFAGRHGPATFSVTSGALVATGADDCRAVASLPLSREYDGPPEAPAFAQTAAADLDWALLLVRKGGFAVAALHGPAVLAAKVGQRHVQGRTKAGGQSQQRFARRRENQARQAYEAAAGHAHRILVLERPGSTALVCGGDRAAVDAVLSDPRLSRLAGLRVDPWLPVPDPRRAVVDQAVADALSVTVLVTDPAAPDRGPTT